MGSSQLLVWQGLKRQGYVKEAAQLAEQGWELFERIGSSDLWRKF